MRHVPTLFFLRSDRCPENRHSTHSVWTPVGVFALFQPFPGGGVQLYCTRGRFTGDLPAPAGGRVFCACTAAPLPPPPGFPDFEQNKRVFPVRTPLPGYPLDRIQAGSCLYPLQLTPYGQESGPFLSEAWQGAKEIRRSSR